MLETLKLFVCFVFFVCRIKTVQSANDDSNYLVDFVSKAINFGKAIPNAALHGSILKTVLVSSEFHCQMECVLHRPCLSYNFDTTLKQVGYLCELNGKDRFLGLPSQFNRTVKGYLYRGVKTSCDQESFCVDPDKICVLSYETKKAECLPPWLPVGESLLKFKQIDSGNTGAVWGILTDNSVYKLNTDQQGWTTAKGGLKHITSGKDCVWGVNQNDQIFYREGIVEGGVGTWWTLLSGRLKQIDCGLFGVVYGISPPGIVYYRAGITDINPKGTAWAHIDGVLNYISCGLYGCWGVNSLHQVFLRADVTPQNPAGSGYLVIPGVNLKQIECGAEGAVWGVTTNNEIVYRTNVTASNPTGDAWDKVPGSMIHVTVGCDAVYGIDNHNKVFIYVGKYTVSFDVM